MARWRLPPDDPRGAVKLGAMMISGPRVRIEPAPFKEKPRAKRIRKPRAPRGHQSSYPGLPALFKAAGLPAPVLEYVALPPRKWRLDAAWPELRIALEIDGGVFSGGAHVRGARIRQTHEKQNALAAAGWRIWHYLPETLKRAPVEMGEALRDAVDAHAAAIALDRRLL